MEVKGKLGIRQFCGSADSLSEIKCNRLRRMGIAEPDDRSREMPEKDGIKRWRMRAEVLAD